MYFCHPQECVITLLNTSILSKTKILMICLGNICRSPLAEGILKSKVNPEDVQVDSAGTGNWHVGNPPDPRSIEVAKKNKIDISRQVCRQFRKEDFDEYDLIYVMDNSNKEDILAMAETQDHRDKVKLLLNEIFPGENVDVPDPYYGGPIGFQNVFEMIEKACDKIATKL